MNERTHLPASADNGSLLRTQRHDLVGRAWLDRFLGHAEEDAGLIVLCNSVGSILAHGPQAEVPTQPLPCYFFGSV